MDMVNSKEKRFISPNIFFSYFKLIILLVFLTSSIAYSENQIRSMNQSILNYFIPDKAYNVASFTNLNLAGEQIDSLFEIYYVKRGPNYHITHVSTMQGTLAAMFTLIINSTFNEIVLIKKESSNLLKSYDERVFNPHSVILKMPPANQSVTWEYIDETGAKARGRSSWASVSISGKNRKAIKLEKYYPNSPNFPKMTIYYVYGIGYWKCDADTKQGIWTMDRLINLGYDPEVNNFNIFKQLPNSK